MHKVGFIGLGAMGRPMAVNILTAGYELVVFDVVKEAVEQMAAKGAKTASNPCDIAKQCDVVLHFFA